MKVEAPRILQRPCACSHGVTLLLLIWLTAARLARADDLNPAQFDFDKELEAAYFGDIEKLKSLLGDKAAFETRWNKGGGQFAANLLGTALEGRSYQVIGLLVGYGFPRWATDLDDLFGIRLTVEDVDRLASDVPEFAVRHGPSCLAKAVGAGNKEAVKALIKAGVKLDTSYGNRALHAALLLRNSEMIRILLDAGVSPYDGGSQSAIDVALKIKSANLLRLLDREGKHADALKFLEQTYAPEKDSPVIGAWVWRPTSGGFGTLSVQFHDDGSALLFTDVGGAAGLWKQQGKRAAVVLLEERQPAKQTKLEFELSDGGLRLIPPDGSVESEKRVLKRAEQIQSEEGKHRRHPRYALLQDARIRGDKALYLQINDRYIELRIADLEDAAKEPENATKPSPRNIVSWEKFERGPIPIRLREASKVIPFVRKPASPAYHEQLGYDHSTPVVMEAGQDWTLFPLSGGEYHHAADSGQYGEHLGGFALKSAKPFSHGKTWVLIFFRRALTNQP